MIIRPGRFYRDSRHQTVYYVINVYQGDKDLYFGNTPLVFDGINMNIKLPVFNIEASVLNEEEQIMSGWLKSVIKIIWNLNSKQLRYFKHGK